MIEVPRRARTGERFAAAEAECKYGVSPAAEICGVYSGAERLFMLGRGNRAEWGREEGNEGKEEDGNEREREGERIPHPTTSFPRLVSLFPFSLSFFTPIYFVSPSFPPSGLGTPELTLVAFWPAGMVALPLSYSG